MKTAITTLHAMLHNTITAGQAACGAVLLAVTFHGFDASAAESVTTADNKPGIKVRVRGGKMQTRIENGKLVLTGFKGGFGAGQVDLKGNISGETGKQSDAKLAFNDVSINKAMEVIGQAGAMQGLGNISISGTVEATWQGKDPKEILSSASGTVTVSTGPGAVTDPALIGQLKKMAKFSELTELRYTSIKLEAQVNDGTIVVNSVTVTGPDFTIAAKGNYSAKADTLNMQIDAKVSPELASRSTYLKLKNVAGLFQGWGKSSAASEGAFVEVPRLMVSGTLTNPSVSFGGSLASVSEKTEVKTVATADEAGSWSNGFGLLAGF